MLLLLRSALWVNGQNESQLVLLVKSFLCILKIPDQKAMLNLVEAKVIKTLLVGYRDI
jgi:hypothetical protein